jgi:flavin reductase (DIM6/NTAB) family NADH-FMN oxidoreductase RutF
MSPSPDAFDRLVAQLDYPMAIVTAASGDERSGCLVGFHTQCSLEPPRYWVCISKANHTFGIAEGADCFAVHFPTPEDRALAQLFGEETGDDVDKFARCSWSDGPGGAPVLDDVDRWFVGRVLARFDGGDHVGFLLEPVAARCEADAPQLGFQAVKDMPPGHPA